MARRAYTQFLYDRLVNAFREKPGNAANAARYAGCERRCALRAWHHGWPAKPWAIPIKDYLEKERELVRAERQKAMEERARVDEETRERMRQDAIDAQKQEAIAGKAARVNAIALSNMISKLLPSLIHISDQLGAAIKSGKHTFTPAEAVKIMSRASHVVRQANESVRLALEIERLRVGDPSDPFKKNDAEELNDEETVELLMSLNRTLRRAKKEPMAIENEPLVNGGNGQWVPPKKEKTVTFRIH